MHALVVSSGDREFGILAQHFEALPVAPKEIRPGPACTCGLG